VRRSYHTEELLPVIVVIVAVAMAGYLTIAVMLTIPGWLYWLYVVMKDRGRKLIDFSGGVSPDGTDVKYAIVKTQVNQCHCTITILPPCGVLCTGKFLSVFEQGSVCVTEWDVCYGAV
jgi:hypothetical protein